MPVIFLVAVAMVAGLAGVLGLPSQPRRYPEGHVHEYDPTGEYTYKHQNPKFKENT